MQDLQSIAGGTILGAPVDRRLRPLSHHYHHHQPLKCPRCDSTNTKFCYYNNYNLSQPRHFCKSCRRYWTKGGVLRNVPVGGGCRKNKRSKAKPPPPEQPENETAAAGEVQREADSRPLALPERKSNSHSSSENSILTAAAETPIATSTGGGGGGGLLNMRGYESLMARATGTNPDGACMNALLAGTGALTDLTGVVTATTEPINCVPTFSNVTIDQSGHDACLQQEWSNQDQDRTLGDHLFDQTVHADLTGMGFGPSDWQMKDQGIFGLPATVDQAYWNQGQSQWTDRDQGQDSQNPLPHMNLSHFLF